MTHENLVSPIGWLIHETVCLSGLLLPTTLIGLHLKLDWINFGTNKILHNVYDFRAQLQGTGSRSEMLYE